MDKEATMQTRGGDTWDVGPVAAVMGGSGLGMRRRAHRISSPLSGEPDEEVVEGKEERRSGRAKRLTQYVDLGRGFTTAPTTVRRLPKGVYRIEQYGPINYHFETAEIQSDSLVQFADTKAGEVVKEIAAFWGLRNRYARYGFTHKRGILLWGPPGAGKSCTLRIIMRDVVAADGIVVLAGPPQVLAPALAEFRSVEPRRRLVCVFEDIDESMSRWGAGPLLAFLDGETQIDGVVFLATTNFPERLDGRLLNRPSRFDRVVKIDYPNSAARAQFLRARLEGKTTAPDGTDLVAASEGMSFAHLRELIASIFCAGLPVADVVDRLRAMKNLPSSSEGAGRIGFGPGRGRFEIEDDDDDDDNDGMGL